jgi:ribosomal protein S18 acetylase RimI-like enzyme
MNDTISYRMNRSSTADISAHLSRGDATFEPTLSSRVDIHQYAQKLHALSVRFEAWRGEELVGLVATYCNQHDERTAFVTNVSVWTECQGLGIASHLMRQCIEHVQKNGFDLIELRVNQLSSAAVALYRKFGFQTLGTDGITLSMGKVIEGSAKQ